MGAANTNTNYTIYRFCLKTKFSLDIRPSAPSIWAHDAVFRLYWVREKSSLFARQIWNHWEIELENENWTEWGNRIHTLIASIAHMWWCAVQGLHVHYIQKDLVLLKKLPSLWLVLLRACAWASLNVLYLYRLVLFPRATQAGKRMMNLAFSAVPRGFLSSYNTNLFSQLRMVQYSLL